VTAAKPLQTTTGADVFWQALEREGVATVFGYPGGAIMPIYDAMTRHSVHHVLVRHEQGAAHMADGYARASGEVGVAIATSGPGATNLVTGLATAMLDSIPIVCITGQVPSQLLGTDAFQETDMTGVTLPITKHSYLVTRGDEIAETIREAFHIARTGRPGPVLVDITKDAQQAACEPTWSEAAFELPGYQPDTEICPHQVARAVELVNAAERPLILVGHGVVAAGASRQLDRFIRRCDAPAACTLLGLGGLPASHPRHLGMMGMHGEAWVNSAIQKADLLIALGMRFDDRVTGKLARYAPNAKKVHVDVDPSEIGKLVKIDAPVVGDVRDVLELMVPQVTQQSRSAWNGHIDALRQEASLRDVQQLPDDGKFYAAHVIHDLWRLTEGKAIIVSDVGQHQMWAAQYYHHDEPRTLITSGGLGTMGFALPAAIGARFARGEAEIWVIAGDGGFQMTACELSTCAQEGIKLNIAIINNGYLGMVRQWQQFFFEQRYVATPISAPDFVMLAEAHGLQGLRVNERGQVDAAVRAAQAAPGTVLIDFRVEANDVVYPMVPTGADLDDMIRRPLTANTGPQEEPQ
jgi:acetolactate synthase-1/2/3 large subunit